MLVHLPEPDSQECVRSGARSAKVCTTSNYFRLFKTIEAKLSVAGLCLGERLFKIPLVHLFVGLFV